jgi:hypothetical protein
MKILITTLFTLCALPAFAQTPAPSTEDILKLINPPPKVYTAEEIAAREKPVTVTQGYVDDSTEAFTEVVALHDLALKFLTGERPANEAERRAAQELAVRLNAVIAGWKDMAAQYAGLVAAQKELLAFQLSTIKTLTEMVQNPQNKSLGSKIWKGLKRAAELVIVFMAGRASGVVGENVNQGKLHLKFG